MCQCIIMYPLGLNNINMYIFFPTYYSIPIFSKHLPIIPFKLPIILFVAVVLNFCPLFWIILNSFSHLII